MGESFSDVSLSVFEGVSLPSIKVVFGRHKLFVCGGEVDVSKPVPPSFRDRFLGYTAKHNSKLHDSLVLAETFKDYFKDNAYPDLLVFEEEIANASSLIILFLESPGSLVELGMFCSKPTVYNKLVIVAPEEEVNSQDSFIYLGPLEYLKKKQPNSVLVYPWPSDESTQYDEEHLEDLADSVEEKLKKVPHSFSFNSDNSGHVAFLIHEIVSLCFPVLVSEVESILAVVGIDRRPSDVERIFYLLEKLEFVFPYQYSGNKYYCPKDSNVSFVKFSGSCRFDRRAARVKIAKAIVNADKGQDKKRRNALKEIMKLSGGRTNESG